MFTRKKLILLVKLLTPCLSRFYFFGETAVIKYWRLLDKILDGSPTALKRQATRRY